MSKTFKNGKMGWNEMIKEIAKNLAKKENKPKNKYKHEADMKEIRNLIFTIGYFCLLAMLLLYSKGITLF